MLALCLWIQTRTRAFARSAELSGTMKASGRRRRQHRGEGAR